MRVAAENGASASRAYIKPAWREARYINASSGAQAAALRRAEAVPAARKLAYFHGEKLARPAKMKRA